MPVNVPKGRPFRDPEAADRLGCRPQTLANARSTGQGVFASIPYYKVGRAVRYFETDIEEFLSRHRIDRGVA